MKPKILDIDLNSPKERQQMDWEADIQGFHLAPLEKKQIRISFKPWLLI